MTTEEKTTLALMALEDLRCLTLNRVQAALPPQINFRINQAVALLAKIEKDFEEEAAKPKPFLPLSALCNRK